MADEIIKYEGTVLGSPIVPGTSIDEFATHKSQFGQGGWREVATIVERDAIPTPRRSAGMSVYVTSEQKLYVLQDDLVTWNEFKSGSTDSVRKTDDLSTFVPMVNGEIVEYIGTTTQDYTNGYFYKVTENITYADASGILVGGNLSNLEVDVDVFVNSGASLNEDHIIHYSVEQESWLDADNNPVDLVAWGVSVEGEVEDNDSMNIRVNSTTTYPATRVDVQPDQTFTLNQKTLPQVGKNIDLPVVEQRTSLTLYSNEEHDAHLGEIVQYIGATYEANGLYHGYFYQWTHEQIGEHTGVYYWKQWNVQPGTTVIDNVTTQSSTEALSANMGYELNQRIDNIESRGRYLSNWNCQTKKPETDPLVLPYILREGDYYIVSSAVKAEPESCTMTITEGSTFDSQFQQNTYKQKVGTDADRLDYFAYTTMRSMPSMVYGNEKVVLRNQSKFSEIWSQLVEIANNDPSRQSGTPDLVSVTKLQFRWFYFSGTLYRAVEIFGLDENGTEYQIYSNTLNGNINGQFAYTEQQDLISEWLLESFGLGCINDIYVPQTVMEQETWHAVELSNSSDLKWTMNGSELPEGDTISSYGVVPVMVQPVLGDSFTIVYRTLKQNFRPEIEIVTIEGEQKKCYNGHESTVVETEEVHVNDTYLFDGNSWILLSNTQKEVSFAALAGNPYDNVELANALNNKVSKVEDASIVYGTDENGEQTTYDMTAFSQIDNVAVHGVDQTITDKRVDLSVIEQLGSLPLASEDLVGRVVQYTGGDTQDLVHNYFYECKPIYTDETTVVQSASEQLIASADLDTFAQSGLEYNTQYLYEKHGAYWDCIDPEGITISGPRAGLVLSGVVNTNDQVILEVDREFVWEQVDVQPQTDLIWGNITGTLSDQTDLQEALDSKQDTLTPGTGIDISTDASTGNLVISSTSSESFYRGTFNTWALVPTNPTSYVEDPVHHLKTPTNTDYMIVTDASDYYKPGDEITIQARGYVGGVGYVLDISGKWDAHLTAYDTPYERVYGNNELIVKFESNSYWGWRVIFNTPVVLNGIHYDNYDEWTIGQNAWTRVFNEIVDQPCEGTWRFGYYGEWDTVGRNGWVAEYKIEDTLPIATDTVAGITKLYTTTGSNTDGTMDQSSITIELGNKQDLLTNASNAGEGIIIDDVTQEISTNNIVWRKW